MDLSSAAAETAGTMVTAAMSKTSHQHWWIRANDVRKCKSPD